MAPSGTTLLRQSILQIVQDHGLSRDASRPSILVVIHWPTRDVLHLRVPDVLDAWTPDQLEREDYVFRTFWR